MHEVNMVSLHMNKSKVMISGERQKPMQKAARWPCEVCGRGEVLVVIQYSVPVLFQLCFFSVTVSVTVILEQVGIYV